MLGIKNDGCKNKECKNEGCSAEKEAVLWGGALHSGGRAWLEIPWQKWTLCDSGGEAEVTRTGLENKLYRSGGRDGE